MFQHRHYKAIAAVIADFKYLPLEADNRSYVAEAFTEMFAKDNPRFDRARFVAACMGQPINGRDKVRP